MKIKFILNLLFISLSILQIKCNNSEENGKKVTITEMGWVIENIDSSFWNEWDSAGQHAFYDFFINYGGDISASDIQSVRVYTPDGYYWTLNQATMLDTENLIIGGWHRFYDDRRPSVLPIGEFAAEIILYNGHIASYVKNIPAPGSTATDGFSYVYSPEDVSPFSSAAPLIKRAIVGDNLKSETEITISFTTDDPTVYNGWVWFYDENRYYLGVSSKWFRDFTTGELTSIINDLVTDGTTDNTITLHSTDITYGEGAAFEQISKFIIVLTDGWQYANQGIYSFYDCRSISEKAEF